MVRELPCSAEYARLTSFHFLLVYSSVRMTAIREAEIPNFLLETVRSDLREKFFKAHVLLQEREDTLLRQ